MNSNKSHLKVTSNLTEWSEKAVKYIAKIVGGGTPSTKISEYWNGDIPWITPKDLSIQQHKYICKGLRNITSDGLNKSSVKIIPSNSVILSTRAPVGYIAISRRDITTNQGCHSLIPNNDMDTEFLYYLLLNNVEYLKSQSNGSTFGELSAKVLSELRFKLPPLKEQKAIAKILSDLDSKIELNEKMNRTLETIAQAIFKHWFIDFEFPNEEGKPYKSNGGEMVDSELGKIPKGWTVGTVYETANVLYGFPLSSKLFNSKIEGLPIVRNRDLIKQNPETYTREHMNEKYIIKKGDVLVGMDGDFRVALWKSYPAILNQRVCKFEPKQYVANAFLYFALNKSMEYFERSKVGTTVIHLGKSDIDSIKLVLPDTNIMSKYKEISGFVFEKMVNNGIESISMVNILKIILPKLMTGKIRVPLEDEHE